MAKQKKDKSNKLAKGLEVANPANIGEAAANKLVDLFSGAIKGK